jgi:hypothetical protein
MIKQILDSLVDEGTEVSVCFYVKECMDKVGPLTVEDGIYKWQDRTFTWQNVQLITIFNCLCPYILVD